MSKNKICNQFFVKDVFRDKRYNGTLKCACCDEESNMNLPYPIEMTALIKFIDLFTKLHASKGCNKAQIVGPDWASGEVNFGIAF